VGKKLIEKKTFEESTEIKRPPLIVKFEGMQWKNIGKKKIKLSE